MTSRTCIIHFGMHKTGSSSIQQTLFEKGAGPDCVYLHAGDANSSIPLAKAFKDDPQANSVVRRLKIDDDHLAKQRQRIIERFEEGIRQGARTTVLSAEGLTQFTDSEVKRLIDWLAPHFGTIRGIGYVRPVQEYMESMLQQRIKSGMMKKFGLDKLYPRYRERMERFETLLGKDQVTLRPFVRQQLEGGDVVLDFCHQVGIPMTADRVVRANDSLSLEAVALLYVMRRHGPAIEASGAEARTDLRFAKYMRALDGRKLRLKREAVAPFMQEFEEDIAWAEARVGTSLRQLRDTDPPEAIATEAELQACAAAGIDWINAQKTAGGEPLPADAGLVRLGRSMYKLRRSFAKRDAKQRRRDKPQDAPGRSAEEADESNDMLT